jgi:hypothetical protein
MTLHDRSFAWSCSVRQRGSQPQGLWGGAVGSAVNGGQWLPEAVDFARRRQLTLRDVPVALFSDGNMGLDLAEH